MPWKGVTMNEQRQRFLEDYKLNVYTTTDLADRFGISRRTPHKWVALFEQSGLSGYHELSRRPHSSPSQTDPAIVQQIVDLRVAHPRWGPSILLALLRKRPPKAHLTTTSTAPRTPRAPWRRPRATSPGSSRSSAFLIASALTMASPSPPPPSLAYPPSPSGSSSSASTPSSSSLAGPRSTPYDYPSHYLVRRVSRCGTIRVLHNQVFVSNTLNEDSVGLEEVDDGIYDLYFCFYQIGRYHLRDNKIEEIVSRVGT